MDEDISIIDSRTRNEKIKNFFIKNKKTLIVILSSIILIVFAYFAFAEIQDRKIKNLAEKYNISREDQDKFAYHSQMKASKAQCNQRLAQEIVTVEIPQRKKEPIIFCKDEFIKENTTLEILSTLRTLRGVPFGFDASH